MDAGPDDHEHAEASPRDLPGTVVPRWLAWLVLVALLAAGGKCVEWALSGTPHRAGAATQEAR